MLLNYALLSCSQEGKKNSVAMRVLPRIWKNGDGTRSFSLDRLGRAHTAAENPAADLYQDQPQSLPPLLKITSDDMEAYRLGRYAFYGRILGL